MWSADQPPAVKVSSAWRRMSAFVWLATIPSWWMEHLTWRRSAWPCYTPSEACNLKGWVRVEAYIFPYYPLKSTLWNGLGWWCFVLPGLGSVEAHNLLYCLLWSTLLNSLGCGCLEWGTCEKNLCEFEVLSWREIIWKMEWFGEEVYQWKRYWLSALAVLWKYP